MKIRNPKNTKKKMLGRIKYLPDGCWEWQGAVNSCGYGNVSIEGDVYGVHRVMWQLLVGPLTPDLTLDHLCRNRLCCNPEHLEEVTMKENILRGVGMGAKNARKTHCKNGHEFDEINTYHRAGYGRYCRECGRQANRRSYARRKAQ